jgi:hypothetical protein
MLMLILGKRARHARAELEAIDARGVGSTNAKSAMSRVGSAVSSRAEP